MQKINTAMHRGLVVAMAIFVLGVLHRILTFDLLKFGLSENLTPDLQLFIVGACSDLWVSIIGGFGVSLVVLILPNTVSNWFARILVCFVGLSYALHQPYVEFFHFPFIPAHFNYLFDWEFFKSNNSSTFNYKSAFTFFAGVMLAFVVGDLKSQKYKTFIISSAFFVICSVGLGLHAFQIKYRVQWFVPEPLKFNMFEGLIVQSLQSRSPLFFSEQEWVTLQQSLLKTKLKPKKESELANVLLKFPETPLLPMEQSLSDQVQQRIKNQKKPIVLTILFESLRPSEIGIYADNPETKSITPVLDEMANTGIWFSDAFSTGLVTRGGQEAVLCGYLSGQTTAMMRNRLNVNQLCLPQLASKKTHKFWYHAGEGRFDSQENFWRRHQIDDIMTKKDFPDDTPYNDWGKSDCALFNAVTHRIRSIKNSSPGDYALGMVLTVSNHIPWKLPSDAPESLITDKKKWRHESHKTTAYMDYCLGNFVELLKKEAFWEDVLLVMASDHGALLPQAYNVINSRNLPEDQLSHVYLSLNGGVVEDALKTQKKKNIRLHHTVSQVDVATTLARILSIQNFKGFGESLFDEHRHKPVLVELSQDLYIPQVRKKLPFTYLTSDELDLTSEEAPAALYFKGFLYLIDHWEKLAR